MGSANSKDDALAQQSPFVHGAWDYFELSRLLKERNEDLPTMIVDLDVFDANTRRLAEYARTAGKKLRLATKSIRVPELIRRAVEVGGEDVMQGLMCFSAKEAEMLATHYGFDDLLVAYPTVQESDISAAWRLSTKQHKTIHLMVDEIHHVRAIERYCEAVKLKEIEELMKRKSVRRQKEELEEGETGTSIKDEAAVAAIAKSLLPGDVAPLLTSHPLTPAPSSPLSSSSSSSPSSSSSSPTSLRSSLLLENNSISHEDVVWMEQFAESFVETLAYSFRKKESEDDLLFRDDPDIKAIRDTKLKVCIDLDVSYHPLPGVHLGAHRSPVRSLEDFVNIVEVIKYSAHVELTGIMGYEAHIAGFPDKNPTSIVNSVLSRTLKWLSTEDVAQRRKEISDFLMNQGIQIQFFNGGGTGSIEQTAKESWLTEVTAGSGFLQSQLFDYYRTNVNQPAFCFALQVSRIPEPDVVCCHSGGFIASGAIAEDKAPTVFLPHGLTPFENEGFGEVQTPLKVPFLVSDTLQLLPGDMIFFRPAKAGEIAEHFNYYLLKRKEGSDHRFSVAQTYRGLGFNFH